RDDHGDERDGEVESVAHDYGQSHAGGNGDGLRPDGAGGGGGNAGADGGDPGRPQQYADWSQYHLGHEQHRGADGEREWLTGDGDGGGSGDGDDHGDERDGELESDAHDYGQSSAGGN